MDALRSTSARRAFLKLPDDTVGDDDDGVVYPVLKVAVGVESARVLKLEACGEWLRFMRFIDGGIGKGRVRAGAMVGAAERA